MAHLVNRLFDREVRMASLLYCIDYEIPVWEIRLRIDGYRRTTYKFMIRKARKPGWDLAAF